MAGKRSIPLYGGAVAGYLVEGKGDPADDKDTPAMVGECFRRVMQG